MGAGLIDEAVSFYCSNLANPLFYRLSANTIIVELLLPLFRDGQGGLPLLTSAPDQSDILNFLADALVGMSRENEALTFYAKALGIDLGEADWKRASTHLRNYAISARNLNRRAEGSVALSLGRDLAEAARAELANGGNSRFAAEAWRILGDHEKALICALKGYHWAWSEGPPYIYWYELERYRALLSELGKPEPQLPPFDPSKVNSIPFEAEIRAAIARLKAEKESELSEEDET